jgi:AcrR family transcriptional regulator
MTAGARRPAPKKATATRRPGVRERAAQATRDAILRAATKVFAKSGFAGGRVEQISKAAGSYDRMIYYYFGSKEGLYLAVLEESYRRVRNIESELHLQDLEPEAALRRLVAFTFDHHLNNENYIRLVMSENINRGQYLAQSQRIQELNVPAIAAIRDLYERGLRKGMFRPGLDPVDIHSSISALSFFNVSNRHTFGLIFKLDTHSTAYIAQRRDSVVEMIVRFMRKF